MIKKKRFTLLMFLVFILSNFLLAFPAFAASWGSAYTINNVNTFTDAGTDARGISPGTFGSEYGRLTKLTDGSWLSVVTIYDNNGYTHMSSGGGTRLQVFKSTDNCRTWTLISTIADNNRDLDNGQIVQLPNGELRMSARSVRWQESYRIYIYKSTDAGVSWPYLGTMDANEGTTGSLGNPDKGIYEPHFIILDDGGLACFYANEKHVTGSPSYSQIVSEKISYDNGSTWGSEIWVSWDPVNSASRPGMPVITKMANGNYIVVYEVQGTKSGNIYSKSSSDGKTWTSGIGTQIPNQQAGPYITSLSDGRLVVTSCNQNISISSDFGATWVLDSNPWNLGYNPSNYSWCSVYQTGTNEIASVTSVPRAQGGHNIQIKFATISANSSYYKFINRTTGKCLDNMGSTSDGTDVCQWSNGPSNNQQWQIVDAGGGYIRLICRTGGKCLDDMSRTVDGNIVGQWANGSSNNQLWKITPLNGGYMKLQNLANGKCVDSAALTSDGAAVQMWYSSGSYNQQWQLAVAN